MFIPGVWEVFHVQIASFFRLFISDSFSKFFFFSIIFFESMLNYKFQFTSFNISSIFSINCFLSAYWSIFFIFFFSWIFIANKGKFPDFVCLNNTRLDLSMYLEHFLYLSISEVHGDVFDVNVVNKLSLGFLHIFWLEFKHLTNSVWLVLKGFFCILNTLITYESVSSWFYFFNFTFFIFYYIDWRFHTLNTPFLKFKNIMQLFIWKIALFWKFNEDILIVKLFSIGSKNCHVKWKCSALITIYLKVSHFFANSIKCGSIINSNDSSVEFRECLISVYLWLNLNSLISDTLD